MLKKIPVEYIYEPWKAPLGVQRAAGCIIGEDYPKPIVQHDVVSKENIKKMAAAYAADKEAKGGSAGKLLRNEPKCLITTAFFAHQFFVIIICKVNTQGEVYYEIVFMCMPLSNCNRICLSSMYIF